MLLEMGRAGLMYVGYIEIPYHLLVADGRRSMAVDSIVGSDYPALLLSEDGSVIGLEKAREFLDIRVLVKRTFREVVSQL
jgi:hypothetical protein